MLRVGFIAGPCCFGGAVWLLQLESSKWHGVLLGPSVMGRVTLSGEVSSLRKWRCCVAWALSLGKKSSSCLAGDLFPRAWYRGFHWKTLWRHLSLRVVCMGSSQVLLKSCISFVFSMFFLPDVKTSTIHNLDHLLLKIRCWWNSSFSKYQSCLVNLFCSSPCSHLCSCLDRQWKKFCP